MKTIEKWIRSIADNMKQIIQIDFKSREEELLRDIEEMKKDQKKGG